MFADDSVTYAQAKSGALSHRLRGVERIEHAGSIFHARAAVLELHNQASINGLRADPEVAILRVFQDRIYRVEGTFPRITAPELVAGVSEVRYRISLAMCDPFRLSSDALGNALKAKTDA